MGGAPTRYRVMAWIVGVALVVLVLIGMPLKYFFDNPTVVAVVGTAHGWLYMIYLALTFDLSRRADWPLKRMLLVMLAGTVPFVSFYAERRVSHWLADADRPRAPEPVAG